MPQLVKGGKGALMAVSPPPSSGAASRTTAWLPAVARNRIPSTC